MKNLVIIRHAKSSRDDPALSDFKRPLSKRGLHDAPVMGKFLRKNIAAPDLIISSPALRALSTAKLIAKEIRFPEKAIVTLPELYNAESTILREAVEEIDPAINLLLLVGHNPGVSDFANLVADCDVPDLPTCGIVSLAFNLKSWADIRPNTGSLLFFHHPKKEQ